MNNIKTRLLIHIGVDKAGSTSLQKFFLRNIENLKSFGYVFFRNYGHFYHHLISKAFSDKENVNFENKFTSLNLEEIYQKKKIIKKKLKSDIEKNISMGHYNFIITHEDFYYSTKTIYNLVEYLKPLINEIEILLICRNQLSWKISKITHKAKTWRGDPEKYLNLDYYLLKDYKSAPDYMNVLRHLKKMDLKINLINFHEIKDNNLISEILSLKFFRNFKKYEMIKKQNTNLSTTGIYCLATLNNFFNKFKKKNFFTLALISTLREELVIFLDYFFSGKGIVADKQTAEFSLTKYQKINNEFKNETGIDLNKYDWSKINNFKIEYHKEFLYFKNVLRSFLILFLFLIYLIMTLRILYFLYKIFKKIFNKIFYIFFMAKKKLD